MWIHRGQRYVVVAVLIAALGTLTGCDPAQPVDPSPSASAGPTGPAVTSAPAATARPVAIADASTDRLLQASDLTSSYDRYTTGGDELAQVVHLPCATGAPASDAGIIDRAAISMSFGSAPPPVAVDSQVSETLTRYGPGGAAQYMSELTAALSACPSEPSGSRTLTRTVVERDFAGDESVLIGISYPPNANPAMLSISGRYQVVLRADDVVMVLLVGPFETGDVRRDTLDRTLEVAIARAED
jgi:hypothetical protein